MNFRLYKETMVNVAHWLERQDVFEPDIAAYGRYFLDSPPIEHAIPSIRKFHRLDDFPWPEKNCIIFVGRGATPYFQPFYLRSEAAPHGVFVDSGTLVGDGDSMTRIVTRLSDDAHKLLHHTLERIQNVDLSDGEMKELWEHCCQEANGRPEIMRFCVVADGPRWYITYRFPDEHVEPGWSSDSMLAQRLTVGTLYDLCSLVAPTGYKIHVRPPPFGPQRLRKAFASRPIIAIVNFERLYHLYRQARPADEAVQRFVQPHHRRHHPRHLWGKAGLRLESLPRRAVDREILVAEKNVPIVMVRECWVGHREFSLNGWDFEVDPEGCA